MNIAGRIFGSIAGACLLACACSLFVSLDDLRGGDAAGGDADAPDGACPGTAGPPMLRIAAGGGASYCIDTTEVTNAQYNEFLAAAAGFDRSGLPAICASHGPFVPVGADGGATFPYAPGRDNYPVGDVDWCDAYAYCSWAGKRLCGRIGGGPNPPSDAVNASASQWFHACSLNGTLFYPYGNVYDGGVCNSRDRVPVEAGTLLPVGSLAGCQGGYPGLFDMSGNVEELEDSCDDAGACFSRGGSYLDQPPQAETRCDTLSQIIQPGHHSWDIGFRCCGP